MGRGCPEAPAGLWAGRVYVHGRSAGGGAEAQPVAGGGTGPQPVSRPERLGSGRTVAASHLRPVNGHCLRCPPWWGLGKGCRQVQGGGRVALPVPGPGISIRRSWACGGRSPRGQEAVGQQGPGVDRAPGSGKAPLQAATGARGWGRMGTCTLSCHVSPAPLHSGPRPTKALSRDVPSNPPRAPR